MDTQYIGARYVPKFYQNSVDPSSIEWETSKPYEPMTVVSYQGDSYTSKIPVPASVGNPASNPTYWAKTGEFNAAINALQTEVDNIENVELPAIRTDISDVETRTGIKKVVMIGDSYAGTSLWHQKLAMFLGLSSSQWINATQGSTGFTCDREEYGLTNNGFLRLLQQSYSSMTADEKSEISHVVIIGGVNDRIHYPNSSALSNLIDNIELFIETMHTNYPNAKLYLGFCGMIIENVYSGSGTNNDLIFTEMGYKRGALSPYVHYMDRVKYALATPYYTKMCDDTDGLMKADGLHPTPNGGDQIAWFATLAIMGESCTVNTPVFSDNVTITMTDSTEFTRAFNQYLYEDEYMCDLSYTIFNNLNITFAEPYREVKIGSFNIPRSTYFNRHHRIQEQCIAIYDGVDRVETTMMFDYFRDKCDIYVINVAADTLKAITPLHYFELRINAFTK